MGSDCGTLGREAEKWISIHAPTWGATRSSKPDFVQTCISIHAPTWGATIFPLLVFAAKAISIHAPTWGATPEPLISSFSFVISIHAPTWGATLTGDYTPEYLAFQSTLPRGERRNRTVNAPVFGYFNPRSHVGSDGSVLKNYTPTTYFNPRSHVGSDSRTMINAWWSYTFQSTLPRGERLRGCGVPTSSRKISIHAPTWGAT